MQRPTYLSLSSGVLTALALLAPGCMEGDDSDLNAAIVDDDADLAEVSEPGEDATPLDPPTRDLSLALSGIDADFNDAADEFGVPVHLLQAVGYAETQWQMVEGMSEFEGQEPAFGVMALRGERLALGAKLIGADIETVKTDRASNIRAAAALLSADADTLGFERSDVSAWAPAVARFSGISDEHPEIQANYVHNDVYAHLRNGVVIKDFAGKPVAQIEAIDATPNFAKPIDPSAAPGPDYSDSVWHPSPNFSSRPSGAKVKMIVIHSCEGAYSGCWGWLVNKASGVSANYVVKEDGSEISQLVKEASKAWHIAASYDCKLNSSKECGLAGQSTNNFSVGIEHAGFAKTTKWSANLIDKSAKLVCDITKGHAIPRDKYHIVAHGQLQPYNRIDPGPNWPWATYLSKVNTHCGAAPPVDPPPPPPPSGSTIIIDSNNSNNNAAQAKVAVSGNWTSTAGTPGYYGSGYFFANTEAVSDAAEFSFYLPAAATRTIDVWYTAGTNRSTTTPIVAFNASGTKLTSFTVNQTINGGKWVQLGTASFSAGWNKVVVSRWTTAGKVVIADAVRVR